MDIIKTDVVILGGGLSGQMMAKRISLCFPELDVLIVDKIDGIVSDHPFHLHRTIPDIPALAKLQPTPMRVNIYDGMTFKDSPSVMDISKYSMKIFDRIQVSNINNAEKQIIYPISKKELYESFCTDHEFKLIANVSSIDISLKVVYAETNATTNKISKIEYKYLVNTIPLPVFMRLCGEIPPYASSHPFYIASVYILPTHLYHMCYCISEGMHITRTTLLNDTLFIEASKYNNYTEEDRSFIWDCYYIEDLPELKTISPGRIDPLHSSLRKPLFYYYTEKYNIFFLGRYGAWSYKVANDVWEDTSFICELIYSKEQAFKFIKLKGETNV